MNGRSVPWRSKPTQDIQETLEPASQLKLYLLQETGPTSFVFKDESESKYKVSIGQTISCSCNPHKKDHCIHTLYVFLKIYKISQENPLIWQASYLDSEIGDLIRSRYNQGNQRPQKQGKFLKRSSKQQVKTTKSTTHRQEFNEDDICPICHENMNEEEGVTFCKKGCGNNFHFKCIMIWSEHRNKIGDSISCPMCRCDWGARAYEDLQREFLEFESRLILHKGHKCNACKSNGQKYVKGKLFHCVYCENYELCEKCFLSFEHFQHNRYLVKETIKDEWKPAGNRDKMYLNNPLMKNGFDAHDIMSLGLGDNIASLYNYGGSLDYEHKTFNDANLPENELALRNFLVSCFPNVGSDLDLVHGKQSILSIVGHDVKKNCSYCHTDRLNVSQLKRLSCGHVMHEHCIVELFGNKDFKCPDDGSDLLKGYQTAFQPQKATQVVEEKSQQKQPQEQKKGIKKVLEEKKSSRSATIKPKKLAPLELDIKGKAVSSAADNNEIPSGELFEPLSNQRAIINSRNPTKKPPTHSKLKKATSSNDNSLPPLVGIQGTNILADLPPKSNIGNIGKKALTPIQNTSSKGAQSNKNDLGLQIGNFEIAPTSIKVLPRKTRKSMNPAPIKSPIKSLQGISEDNKIPSGNGRDTSLIISSRKFRRYDSPDNDENKFDDIM